ncbi:hypothetical protein [Synechococcus sp. CCY 9618]|uniref:hypothetical protein n=1 Tax=Synechococcus sp. CCY 9618 TaxID=2815602 RepID=UPI001C22D963|nr:hypothetical protein [Synechococcus sp. CCY 9618]
MAVTGRDSRPFAPLLALVSTVVLVASQPARADGLNNMRDQLIIHYCTIAVDADFAKAGKAAPQGLAQDTCTCVAEQVNAKASIAQAETICKQQAMSKYNLSP